MTIFEQPLSVFTAQEHEQQRRAALTVCHYATDADEARSLLAALGLTNALHGASSALPA